MVYLLEEYIENNIIIKHYTQDGSTISHTIREPIPNEQQLELFPQPSLEDRVENVENTLNFILLGGI